MNDRKNETFSIVKCRRSLFVFLILPVWVSEGLLNVRQKADGIAE